ncbi:hypothetical protein [Nonomuraea africana]|uniref:hypothetical protein n=1 Tax=Nonomuraea africana TaxID=46171 RepID=UPI003403D821
MQFIETSVIGVRSAVLTFGWRGSGMRFLLVPMVHVAERAFYEQVSELLRGCDLIVAEGEPKTFLSMHRKVARIRVDGLVHQTTALDLESLGIPLLWPDLGGEAGPARWFDVVVDALTAVPDWLMTIGFPRRAIDITDLTGHDGWAGGRLKNSWREAMLHDRDRQLLDHIAQVHRERGDEHVVVGVPWGAHHMTAVAAYLFSELGYRVVGATWLTVRTAR